MISKTLRGLLGTDFGTILGSKIEPKSVQDRSQERSWHKNTHSRFDPQKPRVFAHFSISRRSKSDQQSTKNHLKSDLKFRYQKNTQKCPKKWPTWLQHALKLGSPWGSPVRFWTRSGPSFFPSRFLLNFWSPGVPKTRDRRQRRLTSGGIGKVQFSRKTKKNLWENAISAKCAFPAPVRRGELLRGEVSQESTSLLKSVALRFEVEG